jgi:hypothetical protein
MNKRTILIAVAVVVVIGLWWLFRPERLWVDQTVDEAFPVADAAPTAASGAEAGESAAPEQAGSGEVEMGGATVLASGRFHGVAHEGRGVAQVYQLPDGQRVLRFTEFETSNGPDVRVYLVAADDANDNETVQRAGFVEVGPIKGNQGDQNYSLPADLDLSRYRSVTIWCKRFGVNFATAPLSAGGA